jgi:hypothetical protein
VRVRATGYAGENSAVFDAVAESAAHADDGEEH